LEVINRLVGLRLKLLVELVRLRELCVQERKEQPQLVTKNHQNTTINSKHASAPFSICSMRIFRVVIFASRSMGESPPNTLFLMDFSDSLTGATPCSSSRSRFRSLSAASIFSNEYWLCST